MRSGIVTVLMWGVTVLCACGHSDGGGGAGGGEATQPRVVSTVPAATLNIVQIGGAERLVGVSKFDGAYLPTAEKDLPVVGDYETMDYERLVGLHPTAVVIQTAPARLSGRLMELAASEHFEVVNIQLDTLADLWGTVRRLGKVCGREAAAEEKIVQAQGELKAVAAENAGRPAVTVVYAIGEDPLMIAGGKTFVDEMLTAAGGRNVGAEVGEGYPVIGVETLVKMRPEVMLIGAPGAGVDDRRADKWRALGLPAVKLVRDENALMASTEVGREVRVLAGLLHEGTGTQPGIAATTRRGEMQGESDSARRDDETKPTKTGSGFPPPTGHDAGMQGDGR